MLRFLKYFNLKYFVFSVIVFIALITPHLLIRHSNSIEFLQHSWIENWSVKNFFRSSFNTVDGYADYALPNVVYSLFNWFHPAFIFIGALTLPFIRKVYFQTTLMKIILASILLYAFFLAGIPFQNLRFLLLSFPLVLIILFPPAINLFNRMGYRVRSWVISGILVLQLTLFIRVFIPFYNYNYLEKSIATEIKRTHSPESTIYTFEMEGALNSYGVRNRIVGIWNSIQDSIEVPSLLLFNVNKFSKQWAGTNVMKNYERIRQEKNVNHLKSFEDGWELSQIE
jgi:hypothetical protein